MEVPPASGTVTLQVRFPGAGLWEPSMSFGVVPSCQTVRNKLGNALPQPMGVKEVSNTLIRSCLCFLGGHSIEIPAGMIQGVQERFLCKYQTQRCLSDSPPYGPSPDSCASQTVPWPPWPLHRTSMGCHSPRTNTCSMFTSGSLWKMLGLAWCWKWRWFHQLAEAPCQGRNSDEQSNPGSGGGGAQDPHVLGPDPSRSDTQVPKVRN